MYLLRALGTLSRPVYLLLAAITYTLGAGVARYLGSPIKASALVLGLLGVILAQASMSLLAAVFRPPAEALIEAETPEQRGMVRNAALYTAVAALAALGVIAFAIHTGEGLSPSALASLGLSLLVLVLYAVPPARGMDRGFGELLLAVQIAYLAPSIGFLVQAGNYHRLLTICTVALTLLLLATLVVLGFPSYADDVKHDRSTLLTRIGWERALRTHHLLVICAYLLLALPILLGFSLQLFFPAFITIPFALLQAYLLRNLARGGRPMWNLLSANAIAVFGLTAYFLTLSFWLR